MPKSSLLLAGLATAVVISLALYLYTQQEEEVKSEKKAPPSSPPSTRSIPEDKTPKTKNTTPPPLSTSSMDEQTLHSQIEELDKKGKALFKKKQVSCSCCV